MRNGLNIRYIIESRYDLEDRIAIRKIAEKYFLSVKTNKPSKEDVVWFMKQIKDKPVHGTLSSIIAEGYLNLEDIVENDLLDAMYSIRFLETIISNHEDPLPTSQARFDNLFSKLPDVDKRSNLAKALLEVVVDIQCIEKYKPFIDKFFNNLIDLLKAGRPADFSVESFIWRNVNYIPSNVIIAQLRKGLLTETSFQGQCKKVISYLRKCFVPEQIIEDILPYYASTPYAGTHFPYTTGLGIEMVLSDLAHLSRLTGYEFSKDMKRKIYNLFIKPFMSNPSPLITFFTKLKNLMRTNHSYRFYSYDFAEKSLISIASLVTPPSEDVKIVKTLTLLSDATMDLTPESIVEAYAHIKIRREIPVSEEFINLQLKYHINESYVCLNNPCICNLSFWKKIYDENVCCRSKIINNDLLYNDSFKKNFIPKVEDIPLYEQNSDGISWRTISSARCIPYAFLKAFKSKMHPARWLSREVLGSLNEEQLEYIFTNEQTGEMEKLPENILFFNRNLSYKFIASHLLDIYGLYGYNDRRGSHLYHIKLTELVGALA